MLDCFDVRESFHAELAIEATTKRVEDLVFFLRPMPDCTLLVFDLDFIVQSFIVPTVPLMHVAHFGIGSDQAITPGGPRMVWDVRTFRFHRIRKQL